MTQETKELISELIILICLVTPILSVFIYAFVRFTNTTRSKEHLNYWQAVKELKI